MQRFMEDIMIETIGNDIKTKHSKNELVDICNKAINESICAFKHFVTLLEIEPSLFSHLLDMKLIIDYTEEYALDNEDNYPFIAQYISEDEDGNNNIHISAAYVDKILRYIDAHDESEYDYAVDELTTTIVHEAIHCNRDIIVNDGLYFFKLMGEAKKKILDKKNDASIKEEFDNLYSNKLNEGINRSVVLLKVVESNDYSYSAYIYNDYSKCYEIYNIPKRKVLFSNYNEIFKFIQAYLDIYIKNPVLNLISPYKRIVAISEEEFFGGFSDYFPNDHIDIHNLSLDELATLIDAVSNQIGLEESFVETLAEFIVYTKNKKELNVHDYCMSMQNDKLTTIDVKLACQFLGKMSIDDIRWFMLSAYSENFENRFKKIFGDDYDIFIHNMYEIYNSVTDKEDCDEDIIHESENILRKLK